MCNSIVMQQAAFNAHNPSNTHEVRTNLLYRRTLRPSFDFASAHDRAGKHACHNSWPQRLPLQSLYGPRQSTAILCLLIDILRETAFIAVCHLSSVRTSRLDGPSRRVLFFHPSARAVLTGVQEIAQITPVNTAVQTGRQCDPSTP